MGGGGRHFFLKSFYFIFLSPKAGWWDRAVGGRQHIRPSHGKGEGREGKKGGVGEGGFSQDPIFFFFFGFVDLLWRNPGCLRLFGRRVGGGGFLLVSRDCCCVGIISVGTGMI